MQARNYALPLVARGSCSIVEAVLLFYRRHEKRWLCVVVRVSVGNAFLVTAYPTDALKAGEIVWTLFE